MFRNFSYFFRKFSRFFREFSRIFREFSRISTIFSRISERPAHCAFCSRHSQQTLPCQALASRARRGLLHPREARGLGEVAPQRAPEAQERQLPHAQRRQDEQRPRRSRDALARPSNAMAMQKTEHIDPTIETHLAAYGGGGAKAPNSMRSEVVKCAELRMMGAN